MKKNKKSSLRLEPRGPIVAVVGHIDHGKSTLLDYIRKSNIVEGEAGGITQHISAYEVIHTTESGKMKITFLDTPGHEAFSSMRERGAQIADIAILVVSAEDGVKAQTIEAWKTIEKSGVSPIIAINKIDKPAADIEKTKSSLVEAGIYVEGYGGNIPAVAISAKQGTNVKELLDTVSLLAEMLELKADTGEPGAGTVLESFLDSKRGISATLILSDGYIESGMFVLAGGALAPTRIMEDFTGRPIKVVECPSPVKIVGFDEIPIAGSTFEVYTNKKEAEEAQAEWKEAQKKTVPKPIMYGEDDAVIPLVLKADTLGRLEAIKKELEKIDQSSVSLKIVQAGVGNIGENDILSTGSDKRTIILGLGVKLEGKARDQIERTGVTVELFDIIYKLTERLAEYVNTRTPKILVEELTGSVKILKTFSVQKDVQVVGGRVQEGSIVKDAIVKIMRRDHEIGRGKLIELQSQKIKAQEVKEGTDCGMMIESKYEIVPGDVIESFKLTQK